VHVIVNSGLYLQSILYQGQEVSSPKLDLNDGAPGDLELVLSAGVGTVEGTVHWPEESRSADELHVVLVPEKVPLDDFRPKSTLVDQNAHFSIDKLAPGSYRAFAVTNYDAGLWENPDFLAQMARRGTAVELPEKSSAHVEVTVLPASEVQQAEELVN
jgi:hypothetical protein